LYLKAAFSDLGTIAQVNGGHEAFFLGYFGVLPLLLPAPFSGTLVAPSTAVTLGPVGSGGHSGAFFAASLIVNPLAVVRHVPFVHSWVGPGAVTLSIEREVAPAANAGAQDSGGCSVSQPPGRTRDGAGLLALSALGLGVAGVRRRSRRRRGQEGGS
ncbi:MAG: hypothetical protein ACREJ3_04515, partial [Polyangiaceae bacterium]